MTKWLMAACVALALSGCQPEAQKEIKQQSGRAAVFAGAAAKSAGAAIMTAGKSALDEAQKIDWKASLETLTGAKSKLVDLQNQLANLKSPTELDGIRLEQIQNEVFRIEAAIQLQDVERQMLQAIEKANGVKAKTLAEVETQRKRLAEADGAFKKLDKQYQDIKLIYEQTQKHVDELKAKIKALEAMARANSE